MFIDWMKKYVIFKNNEPIYKDNTFQIVTRAHMKAFL